MSIAAGIRLRGERSDQLDHLAAYFLQVPFCFIPKKQEYVCFGIWPIWAKDSYQKITIAIDNFQSIL